MDPAMISGAETIKLGVKLGHHAYDHDHGHDHTLNPQTDAPVNSLWYGLSSMAKPALWGALSVAAFGLIFSLVSGSFTGTETVSAILTEAKTLSYTLAAGITGAIWGAGMGFYKGYTHATEHNALVQQDIDDIETSRGAGRGKTIETVLESAPRKDMVSIGNGATTPIGMIAQQDDAPRQTLAEEPTQRARPQWMQDILERGPRPAAAEQTVAISSQNGR